MVLLENKTKKKNKKKNKIKTPKRPPTPNNNNKKILKMRKNFKKKASQISFVHHHNSSFVYYVLLLVFFFTNRVKIGFWLVLPGRYKELIEQLTKKKSFPLFFLRFIVNAPKSYILFIWAKKKVVTKTRKRKICGKLHFFFKIV